jgi:outer membrane protein assembly factor BamE (lipoprotein component of BamABCDE complex)
MIAALIALLAGCASTPSSSPVAGDHSAANSTMTAPGDPESTLQKGMTAEAVRAIMGEPSEIKPMKSPAGQAEIWIYHRKTQGGVQQVMVGMKSTPITSISSTGQTSIIQSIDEPILRQQTEIIEETVNLLIFEGKFVEKTRSVQKHLEYQ